jgi:hypothetical protein
MSDTVHVFIGLAVLRDGVCEDTSVLESTSNTIEFLNSGAYEQIQQKEGSNP